MIPPINKICCIGAGYVGGPTMAMIALKCPHVKVTVVDINQKRINYWNSKDLNNLPIYEPGLSDIIKECRDKNLFFSTDIENSIREADMIFLSVNTPTKIKGIGAGKASDLKWIEASSRQVAKFSQGTTIVVEKSTLPVRTAETVKKILESNSVVNNEENIIKKFHVLSNPEFLAEGTAINDLENPCRILIGGENEEAIGALEEIYANWVDKKRILRTNIWSSELSKLTANAFLAQRISSINSVSALCEYTGADVREVSQAVGLDYRIGSKFLNASPGFGGSCFKKDILNLIYISQSFGLNEVANYWEQVISINEWQKKRISQLIVKKLFGTIYDKKIGILGFSFKANTNDTRESPSIDICKSLIEEGAKLSIYDPKVTSYQIKESLVVRENVEFNNDGLWEQESNIYNVAFNADAIVILTEWDEFKKLDWKKFKELMRSPSWLFDTRGITEEKEIKNAGLNYWKVGFPSD